MTSKFILSFIRTRGGLCNPSRWLLHKTAGLTTRIPVVLLKRQYQDPPIRSFHNCRQLFQDSENHLIPGSSQSRDTINKPVSDYTESSGRYRISFTCNICKTRCEKEFSKNAYHKGVVIIRCSGCDSMHLIADNLGWFGDKKLEHNYNI